MTELRHRSRSGSTTYTSTYGIDYSHGFSTVVSGTCKSLFSEEMYDQEIPDFHKKLKSGEDLPVNEMIQYKQRVTSPPSTLLWRKKDGKASYVTIGHLVSYSPILHSASGVSASLNTGNLSAPEWPDKKILLQEALAQARGATMDVSTFLVEYNKTLALIANFALNIRRRAAKIMSRKAIKSYEQFLDAWMEYRYGWRILYYDLLDIQESLRVLSGESEVPRRYTTFDENTSFKTETHEKASPSFSVWDGYRQNSKSIPGVTAILTQTTEIQRSIRAGVGLKLRTDLPGTFDPLMTTWEIIPFSFIADWFFNIGDAIGAFSPFGRGSLAWAYVTERHTIRGQTTGAIRSTYSGTNGVTIQSGDIFAAAEETHVHRYPADPAFNIRFRMNLDFPKIIDLMAIVSGFKDAPRRRTPLSRRG